MKQIPLTKGKFALVDDEDFEYLSQWKWYFDAKGYASRAEYNNNTGKRFFMHRVVMKVLPEEIIDHKNLNRIDNRKENLRKCNSSQNCMNRPTGKNNRSGYKGVSWFPYRNTWRVRLQINKKSIGLGYYKDIKLAVKAYNEGAKKYHREFARLN